MIKWYNPKKKIQEYTEKYYEHVKKMIEADIKNHEEEEKKWREYILFDVHKKILTADKFVGNLSEYDSLKDMKHQIIDIGTPDKRATIINCLDGYISHFPEHIRKHGLEYKTLMDQGLCGFIHWEGWLPYTDSFFRPPSCYYGKGLPVKRIQQKTLEEQASLL